MEARHTMILDLTQDDVRLLRELLEDYLPQLRLESARTEARELRHGMVQREELCERLLTRLKSART
jgi:hypothetical protein